MKYKTSNEHLLSAIDWDKPEHIADPEAKKPEDWDDEIDGAWEPPMIDNPEYKGVWKASQIDNPDYKGPWVHPEIDNPDYVEDANIYLFKDIGAIGFDLWQVKSGTIFDNVIITDSVERAEEFGNETWGKTKDPEKKMKDEQDEVEKKKEEEERKARETGEFFLQSPKKLSHSLSLEEKSKKPDDDDESDADEGKSTHAEDEL